MAGSVQALNRTHLLAHGVVAARTAALDIVEHALDSVNPIAGVNACIKRDNHVLSIDGSTIDLDSFEHV